MVGPVDFSAVTGTTVLASRPGTALARRSLKTLNKGVRGIYPLQQGLHLRFGWLCFFSSLRAVTRTMVGTVDFSTVTGTTVLATRTGTTLARLIPHEM